VAEEYAKVEKVNAQLEQLGHAQPDATQLLNECRRRADNARQAYGKRTTPDDRVAYEEAQRALRPLRILMRAHWETAVKALDGNLAVSSPYAVSFYTLPRHWQFVEEQKSARVAPNALANGDFELPPNQAPAAWSLQEVTLDEVDLAAERVAEKPREGRQCLRLQVKPRDPKNPPEALERTFLAITTPQVRMPPGALARVSGWVRIPEPIKASVDGALFFDSIGGEPLAVRLTEKTEKWKQFTLVRRVPDSGLVSVTMALTGLGTVYFDDVRIEPLFPGQGQGQAAAGQPATVVGKR
jgi:hypothetical protein